MNSPNEDFCAMLVRLLADPECKSMLRLLHHRYCRKSVDLLEFAGDVLSHAWERRAAFRWQGERQALGWLLVLACRLAMDLGRRHRRKAAGSLSSDVVESATMPEEDLDVEKQLAQLRQARAGLDADERDLLERHFEGGETLADIADLRGEKKGTLRRAYERLLAKLQRQLFPEEFQKTGSACALCGVLTGRVEKEHEMIGAVARWEPRNIDVQAAP